MPFAKAQTRPDELTSTFGAMDAITTVDGDCELAVPPTFVNIIAKPSPCLTTSNGN
jgi:hypothetical protein